MKKTIKHVLSFALIVLPLFSNLSFGQDPNLTQLDGNRLYLNPANAGASGKANINTVYRNQWGQINRGFNTYKLNADLGFKRLGVGIMLMKDNEGDALQTTYAGLSLATSVNIFSKYKAIHSIHAGAMFQYYNMKFNYSNLLFPDQLDRITGILHQNSSFQLPGNSLNCYGVSWGLLYTYANIRKKTFGEFGFAQYYYFSFKNSFVDLNYKLSPRHSLYGSLDFPLGRRSAISLNPYFIYERQKPLGFLLFGSTIKYSYILGGLAYRCDFVNSDAIIPIIGFETNLFREKKVKINTHFLKIAYSFDYPISRLTIRSGGSHEISISYVYKFKYQCNAQEQMGWVLKDVKLFHPKKNTPNDKDFDRNYKKENKHLKGNEMSRPKKKHVSRHKKYKH